MTDLRQLVGWLHAAGYERITLLDNDSTYPPILEFFEETDCKVIRLPNLGSRALWKAEKVPQDEFFVLSDPDLIPLEECPLDAIEYLKSELEYRWSFPKISLGLYLEDLPQDMPSLDWERSLVGIPSEKFPIPAGRQIAPGLWGSLSDTTFAVHRPGVNAFRFEAIRTDFPYQARHTSWYTTEPSQEDLYYLERAEAGPYYSSWKQRIQDEQGAS